MNEMHRILVVDGSRVVRATFVRHLKGEFHVREEADGESAWQTLVLDSSVVAVICAAQPAKLSAEALLQRMRSKSLRRISTMPFLLIVPENDERLKTPPRMTGAPDAPNVPNGYISRMMKGAEILERIHDTLHGSTLRSTLKTRTDEENPVSVTPAPEFAPPTDFAPSPASEITPPAACDKKLLPDHEIDQQAASMFARARQNEENVCALVFGIDNLDALSNEFGQQLSTQIASRLAALLIAKIGADDSIGQHPGKRLAIVSYGTTLHQCAHFARRVCSSLASGHIVVRGKEVRVTASAGIASLLVDGATSGEALLALAEQRLQEVIESGGNQVSVTALDGTPQPGIRGISPVTEAEMGKRGAFKEKNNGPLLWSSDLNTGIDEIDQQHRAIVDCINEIASITDSKKTQVVDDVLQKLSDYSQSHFVFEESMLEQAKYKLSKEHKAIHDQLIKRIVKYKERHHAGEEVASQIHGMLCTWLLHHIKRHDMAYVEELRSSLPELFGK